MQKLSVDEFFSFYFFEREILKTNHSFRKILKGADVVYFIVRKFVRIVDIWKSVIKSVTKLSNLVIGRRSTIIWDCSGTLFSQLIKNKKKKLTCRSKEDVSAITFTSTIIQSLLFLHTNMFPNALIYCSPL